MKDFNKIFKDWIDSKLSNQIESIDKISKQLEIDPEKWFKTQYLRRSVDHYSGTDFLNVMLDNFLFYVRLEFEKELLKYVKPKGYNIYNEPYLSLEWDILYSENKGLYLKKNSRKNFRKFIKSLTLEQREELMKNNFFNNVITKTNLKIFNIKELRYLKLKKLKNYV